MGKQALKIALPKPDVNSQEKQAIVDGLQELEKAEGVTIVPARVICGK